MVPLIEYGLGYRSRNKVQITTTIITLTLTLTLTLTVKIMYAVQNDTELKFNRVLYIQVIFIGMGVGFIKGL